MPESCLADRFGDLIDLTPGERRALADLETRERAIRRGTALMRENDRTSDLFVVRDGILMSYVLLDDGSRQILRLYFPGDMIACAALAYHRSPETVVALTDSVVSPFDRAIAGEIAVAHPRLMAVFVVLCQIATVTLTDRLAALGRTSAKARIAALLLEIRHGLRQNNPAIGTAFPLLLTQEEMGDAIGLTAVHVNRMIRQLEEEGRIARRGGLIELSDEPWLIRTANYIDRTSDLDLSWLPSPR